MDLAWLIS